MTDGDRTGSRSDARNGAPADAGDDPLAVVVPKPRAEVAIESLRAEGVYDDERRVREYDADRVALPVSAPPTETRVLDVVRQVDPDFRARDLEALLAERGWSDADLATAPGSWAVVGAVILVRIPSDCADEGDVAEALLDLHGEAETVLADEGVAGVYREPSTRHLAGERDTETVHVEAGTRYALDPARVMFSPGNQAERVRMGEVVAGVGASDDAGGDGADASPETAGAGASHGADRPADTSHAAGRDGEDRERAGSEHVFDMFAGIGYFTLPMARAGARVTATEVNPTAFRYLLENAVANDVADRVAAYNADCRALAGGVEADRVVMGYYGTPEGSGSTRSADPSDETGRRESAEPSIGDSPPRTAEPYLLAALASLKDGGVLHYHDGVPESALWDGPIGRLERAVDDAGRSYDVVERRRVKPIGPGVVHVVVDARIE